ncbi:aldehyde dehydrogenase family protein [Sphingobacterium psychroaquaticum]|uniref:Aldehyde dehydrogenase n=1 Tax=Sphingobacterium psychroaquaticum TaxID=561061 RepID=A0A1X7LAJ7_9SPHI|nr:aldehyde dehydrogenase family protein [Sphingobacterium psychroaquaticum]QBQ40450.1 aldehyde dehydrogenase [Sphingobacterium psychroaquaticum]SMG50861.1 aldehyde dehydrogenase [Sphingobacterium psychroaquaticum]
MSTIKKPTFKERYDNYIGGKFVAPIHGKYFDNISPVDGKVFTQAAHSTKEDIELAVDTASKAFESFSKTSPTERSIMLNRIADRIEENLEYIAAVETIDNGKAVRETLNADIPLAIDHFRYFASVIRAEEGSINELDKDTVSIIVHEPIGVIAQIIPWNFPILMAVWKLAPALAAGNCVVLKPAESTPTSILVLMELIGDLIPAGVINVVNGFGSELGRTLVTNPKVSKAAFTGSTATGRMVMQYATENIIPVTLELGGKSPNLFFSSVMDHDDDFLDKAIEGAVLFALNQGEICTCPSRLLIQEDIYDRFIAKVIDRVNKIKVGDPLDPTTMMGAQASKIQKDKIMSYIKLGKEEGAEVLTGGDENVLGDGLEAGYYIKPTLFKGTNKMRIFQEEIFGPVLAVTTFKDEAEAIAIANDTMYGLGAGVWTRDAHQLYQIPRAIQAGRVWVNQYHSYPAGAPFGGYKQSGIGRENHKMMLDHYRQTKNMLVSYSKQKLGFF